MKRLNRTTASTYVKRANRRRKIHITLAAVLAIGIAWMLIMQPFRSTPSESSSNEPNSVETADPETQPTESPSIDPEVTALVEKSQTVAETYYSYNWEQPGERLGQLKSYGQKSWLASVKKAEMDILLQAMRKKHTVRTVTNAEFQDGGDITTAESDNEKTTPGVITVTLNLTVEITDDSSVQPMTLTFPCTLWWEYDAKSKTWLVSQTDPT